MIKDSCNFIGYMKKANKISYAQKTRPMILQNSCDWLKFKKKVANYNYSAISLAYFSDMLTGVRQHSYLKQICITTLYLNLQKRKKLFEIAERENFSICQTKKKYVFFLNIYMYIYSIPEILP